MKIGIIGTSRITNDHIKVLKSLKHNILFISSTRKNSNKVNKLSKKYKIRKTFNDWRKSIEYAKKISNCNFLITSRIQDNFKVLKLCAETKRFIFIEKPVFLNTKLFNVIKNKKNIFTGYNRIFYSNIIKIKKIINKKKNINVIAKCPEINKRGIMTNSCHIISILLYFFKELKIIHKTKNSNFINLILKNKKNCIVNLIFNLKNSDNFSIEIFERENKYSLNPLENLKIYKKIEIKKIFNNFTSHPKLIYPPDEFKLNKFKPGFKKQMEEFNKFTKGKKIVNDFTFSKKIISICENILK